MRNSSRNTLTETERVSTHIICTFTERVIHGVEKKGSGWGKKVLNVLLKCIDLFARWVLSNLSINKNFGKVSFKRSFNQ